MSSNEEIREFLQKEENIQALNNDSKFISEISGGNADPSVYEGKFKDLGLNISKDDAEKIGNVVTNIVTAPPEKIEDEILKNAAGGNTPEAIRDAGLVTGAVSSVASAGLLLSEIVCKHAGVAPDKCKLMLKLSGAGALVSAGAFATAGIAHSMSQGPRTYKQTKEKISK